MFFENTFSCTNFPLPFRHLKAWSFLSYTKGSLAENVLGLAFGAISLFSPASHWISTPFPQLHLGPQPALPPTPPKALAEFTGIPGIPRFTVLRVIALQGCCFIYKLKARPFTNKNIATGFIPMLALLQSGGEPAISPRFACGYVYCVPALSAPRGGEGAEECLQAQRPCRSVPSKTLL